MNPRRSILPRVAVLPAGHPLAQLERIELEDLALQPLVSYHPSFSGRTRVDQAFAARRLKPNIVLEFSPRIYGADVTRAFCIELFACYDRVKMLDAGGIVDCTPGKLAAVTDQVDILLMAAPRQS